MPPNEARTPDLANRFRYHPPTTNEVRRLHEDTRAAVWALAEKLDATIPAGREKALMLTHLEEALMWGNAAIARAPRET